ncbi:DHH family phosphoesterase [Clostridium tertium]|uniref:DHH family phosphoesterase n=1 Tax=Clostridium tertium TaxID=1559 RepID=UPI0023B312DB|nr:DHH family phosphoesterase [Clostridium tertium]
MLLRLENLTQYKTVYIQPHNFPDADAIASAYGLYKLLDSIGIRAKIICPTSRNESTKPNLDKMIRQIESEITFNVKSIPEDKEDFALVIIDVQYGNSNITNIDAKYIYCIDHHEDSLNDVYVESDIRPSIGSCSTIITDYYRKYKVEPTTIAATLLSFGIHQDTGSLSEKTTNLDTECKMWLNDKLDKNIYNDLIHSAFTFDDMKSFAQALENIEQYRNVLFCRLDVTDDNMLGNISDILSEISDVDIVVTYSTRLTGWKLSIRSYNKILTAVDIIEHLTQYYSTTGGGHLNKAGGYIPLNEFKDIFKNITFDLWLTSTLISFTNKWTDAHLISDVNSDLIDTVRYRCVSTVKKQLPIRYIDLSNIEEEYIKISTLTGDVEFNTNTHNVIIGIEGDLYPISKSTFNRYYTLLDSNKVLCPGDEKLKVSFLNAGYGVKVGSKRYKYIDILNLPAAMPNSGTRLAYELEHPTILEKNNSILKGETGDYVLFKDNKPTHISRKDVFESSYDIMPGKIN